MRVLLFSALLFARLATGGPLRAQPGVPDEFLVVRVVDAATREPVAGAELFVISMAAIDAAQRGDRRIERSMSGFDAESFLVQQGVRVPAGEGGGFRVRKPKGPGGVLARAGERIGYADFPRDAKAEAVTVELQAKVSARAMVRDGEGRPCAGVPLKAKQGEVSFRAATDAEGVAHFRNLQFLPLRDGPIEIEADFPGGGTLGSVERAELIAKPAAFVLKPTGRVVVEVRDREGAPFAGQAVAVLGEGPLSPHPRPFLEVILFGHAAVHVVNGRAEFPYVGLGLEVHARVGAFQRLRTAAVAGRGPATAGETVTLRVTAGDPLPVLTGRAVDAEGRPHADAALSYELRLRSDLPPDAGTGFAISDRLQTDAAGRFRIAVEDELFQKHGGRLLLKLAREGVAAPLSKVLAIDPLRDPLHDLGAVPIVP